MKCIKYVKCMYYGETYEVYEICETSANYMRYLQRTSNIEMLKRPEVNIK